MAITLAGNLITLTGSGANPAGGTSWANAYDMDDVLASCGGVVTKQGAHAYDISARMKFESGVYFVSKNEFVELKPNPINPVYTIRADAGTHIRFGEYNETYKYSYNGAFWKIYLASTTGSQSSTGNRMMGELLIYGSNIIQDSTVYTRGWHFVAGATVRIFNSICKWSGYFWAANCNMQDVKFLGGGGTYDMLFATAYDYSFSGVSSIGCNYGLFFSSTTDAPVDVYNQKFLNCIADVGLISTTHLIRVINSPFTTYTALGSGKSFKECYEFNVKVTDDQGSPIVGATVSLKDVDGTLVFSEDTVVGGVLAADKVVVRKWFRHANQGGNKDYNDHTLKVTSGSDETEYKIKIDHKITEDVVLLPQSIASYDNIMAGITDIKGTGFVKDTDSLVDIRPETGKIQGVKDKTDNLPASPAPSSEYDTEMARITADVATEAKQDITDGKADTIQAKTDNLKDSWNDPTVAQIKTELEGAGTKLTSVKGQTDKLHFSGDNVQGRVADKGVLNNPPSEDIADYKEKMSEGELHTGLDNYANKDNFKANVASVALEATLLAVQTEVDKIQTNIIDVPGNFKANVSTLALEATLQTVKTEVDKIQPDIIDVPDNFKANITALALEATAQLIKTEADKIQTNIVDDKNAYKANITALALEATGQLIKTEIDKIPSIITDLDFIKDIEGGKWKIINNQMIFYKADNVTEVARFNLFDSNGNPAVADVFERQKV